MTIADTKLAVALIADDLTGAMDSGLQLAQQGLDAVVMMAPDATVSASTLIYTTESRELPPSQAVRHLGELLPLVGARRIYKKIDSTLRGNIGYELRCLASLATVRAIVVAPAFPQGGALRLAACSTSMAAPWLSPSSATTPAGLCGNPMCQRC